MYGDSIYRLIRDFDVNYDKIPVDASKNMPDEKMDLVEPYKYTALGSSAQDICLDFRQKFMMKIKKNFCQGHRKRQRNIQRATLMSITIVIAV